LTTKRATYFLAAMLICVGPGCNQKSPGAFRQLTHMPELYWERARECKKKQLRDDDQECRVSLEEIQQKKQAETGRQR
jgi:hypothetical protein